MSISWVLAIFATYAAGCYLMMTRALSRIIVGIALFGHGSVLLLILSAGKPGKSPIIDGTTDYAEYSDPLPQALALTAIVITFGILAFLLALAFRSWTLSGDDQVEDDLEDRLVAAGYGEDDEVSSDQSALEQSLEDR